MLVKRILARARLATELAVQLGLRVRLLMALAIPVTREELVAHRALVLLQAEVALPVPVEVRLRRQVHTADVALELGRMRAPVRARLRDGARGHDLLGDHAGRLREHVRAVAAERGRGTFGEVAAARADGPRVRRRVTRRAEAACADDAAAVKLVLRVQEDVSVRVTVGQATGASRRHGTADAVGRVCVTVIVLRERGRVDGAVRGRREVDRLLREHALQRLRGHREVLRVEHGLRRSGVQYASEEVRLRCTALARGRASRHVHVLMAAERRRERSSVVAVQRAIRVRRGRHA